MRVTAILWASLLPPFSSISSVSIQPEKSYQWFHKPWLSVVRVRGAVYDSSLVSISSILSLVSFSHIFSAMEVNLVDRI